MHPRLKIGSRGLIENGKTPPSQSLGGVSWCGVVFTLSLKQVDGNDESEDHKRCGRPLSSIPIEQEPWRVSAEHFEREANCVIADHVIHKEEALGPTPLLQNQ